ncbi:MATE family efflux transporter [Sporosarcina thermotolerans]|uniref:Probable multidrug resistance protein NorM n=1 Tax=Sporosarcina thermotolerans TaxID=633404 RepID=A0AAW9A4X0_9BACL|nr:MATE family efflux transporter [Sporosarcina thermotolerans]MDW0115433.1 MATE family efflux transporter [Sporosarcina thermotolerans]WHT47237.1 MATE family efflux transporter [Sporosarcina thermotolerans]
MEDVTPLKQKINMLFKIIIPILVTQIALYLMTFFDILMTGRYNTEDLAGVTIGSSFWVPVYTGLSGIIMGLTPIIAHLIGGGKKDEVRPSVQQGLYLSIVLAAIVFSIMIFAVIPSLNHMPLEGEVRIVAADYLKGMSIGLLPLFAYTVFRSFFDALGATRVSMFIILLSAPINVFLNFLFIYGNFGFPEMGGAGAGFASGITYWLVFCIAFLLAWKRKSFQSFSLFSNWEAVSLKRWKAILKIGVPIGLSIFVEISIFSVVTLLMSGYTTATISAHQIALNFTSLLYMVPLSISMGVTILVGQSIGAKKPIDAKHYSFLGVGVAILFSFISIIILLTFREPIASLYTKDTAIIKLAIQFFIFAAFFQLSDAIQAPIQGSLRGYKDVNMTFIMAIISFWVIGLPVGYVAANFTELGPYGYWVGLIAGLSIGAISLSIRLFYIQRKSVKRINPEAS